MPGYIRALLKEALTQSHSFLGLTVGAIAYYAIAFFVFRLVVALQRF